MAKPKAGEPGYQPKVVHGTPNQYYVETGPEAASERSGDSRIISPIDDFSSLDEVDDNRDELLDEVLSGPSEPGEIKTFDQWAENHDSKIADYRDRLNQAETAEEKLEVISDITSDPDYLGMKTAIGHYTERYEELTKETREHSSALTKAIDKGEEYPDAGAIYTLSQEAVDAYEQKAGAKALLSDYKNLTATGMRDFHEEHNAPLTQFNGDSLGEMTKGGQFEVGSREWLEYRQGGIGGSDIGTIIDEESKYRKKNQEELWESKVSSISDEEVAAQAQGQDEATDATSRGNAMEEFIASEYRRRNPDDHVMVSKATWVKPGSPFRINYDGLLSSDGKTPDGILEIKTASSDEEWGTEADGIDGLPHNYRAQVLAQMSEAGFKRGALSVIINETDFRTYKFNMTPELAQEASRNRDKAQEFLDKVNNAKASSEEVTNPYKSKPSIKTPEQALTAVASRKPSLEKYLDKVATIRGTSVDSVRSEYEERQANGEDKTSALRSLYTESDLTGRNFIGVDIETTSLAPTTGRIIESGAMSMDMGTGAKSDEYTRLYDIPAVAHRTTGTGAEEVHHISAADLAGKTDFYDSGAQSELLQKFRDSGTLVSHNATFERGWFRAHLKGFAEAESRGEIKFVDTRDVSLYTVDSPRNTLEAFVESQGGQYTGAHRAYRDAEMMMDALYSWSKKS